MSSPGIDQEAFQQFERDGWEQKAAGYHWYFSEVSKRNIEPLLDAAGVKPGSRVLVRCRRRQPPPPPPS